MSEWIVYSKDGLKERCRLKSVEYNGSYMNERVVTATFKHFEEVAFEVFDYIEYRGERFEIEAIPTVKKTSSHDYEYDLRFVSLKYELERCEMRDIVPDDNRMVYPTPLTFSFTGTVRYLAERIQANLDALYGEGVWSITLEDGVESEEKNITISQQNCWNALSLVNTTYNLNFQVRGRNVVIGNSNSSVGFTFKYGKGNGLYEIERTSDSDTGIVTKLRAYGSDRNLDYSYPKKPEWSDSVLDTSFILSPLRLMLPSFKADGKTDYILADEAVIAKYGIREASVIYDDIYPSITGAVVAGNAIDEIKGIEPITDDNASTFVIYLHNLGFDLESHLTTSDAQISMKSGAMQGYTFNMSNIEKQSDGSYKITLGRITTDTSDTGNYSIPNNDWNMKAGDKFVLLNILMPQEYIRSAEERLLERAEEYLAEYGKTNFGYSVGIHDKFLKEHSDIYDQLIEGSKLSVYDEEIGINEEVTIQSLTITENAESNILPQVKVTLNNKPSASTLERIQGQIKELSDSASGSFSSQSELLSQYRKKLDKPFFDRLFAAVDENGNEIPSTDLTTPIFYIKARYNFASLGGITTYLNDGSFNLPSIYAGIPFDNRTIWLNPETKLVEVIVGTGGGGGEGGVSNFWDLTNIPKWITATKPEYLYGEIKDTPDLSEYAKITDVDRRINDLVNGAPAAYDTLKEIADVLQGNVNSIGDIITTLGKKADKTELAKYIPIAGDTEVTGIKNFLNGLKIGGLPISKHDDDVIYIDANVVLRGGLTQYVVDPVTIPSIAESLPFDRKTIQYNTTTKQIEVIGGTGGGITSITKDMVVEALGYTPYNSTNPNGFITSSALSSYLPLSGGTLTGNLALKSTSASDDTPKLYFQRGTTADGYYDCYIYNTGGGLTFGYSSSGTDYDLVKVTSTTLRPNSNNTYALGSSNYNWGNIYTNLINGGTPIHSNNIGSQSVNYATSAGDADTLNGVQLSGLFTSLSSTVDTNLSITVGGVTKSIALLYSKGAMSFYTPWNNPTSGSYDLNSHLLGMARYYGSGGTLLNAPSSLGYGSVLCLSTGTASLSGQLAWNINHASTIDTTKALYWRAADSLNGYTYAQWHQIAFTDSNVASATKLQTARKIWGQDFDGTGDVNGVVTDTGSSRDVGLICQGSSYKLGFIIGSGNTNRGIYDHTNKSWMIYRDTSTNVLIPQGNVGIGTTSPAHALHVVGNILTTGGITQYSDIRKKTKLNNVELTLKQVANAPLIEHYYNSDDKKTTHVGSIAQYWAEMNDWFCKLDSDGYYTMEIQNAALASAISVARELERYESKTDKKIRMLKKRINELEDEIEKLKSA